jgi:polyisoprenoid-binding protein YceI
MRKIPSIFFLFPLAGLAVPSSSPALRAEGAAAARPAGAVAPAAPPVRLDLAKSRAVVEFEAVGWPSALKIHGKGGGLHGKLALTGTRVEGAVSFDLKGLDTGIGLRDRHMKEKYLETGRFPEATLELSSLDASRLPSGEAFVAERVPFTGVLTLHGVSRPVTGQAAVRRNGSEVSVAAGFELRTSDYGIATPSYVGITMAEQVRVKVGFSAPLEAPVRADDSR